MKKWARRKRESTMTKRNKKQIRRLRHARRLHKIITDAAERAERMKPNDEIVLRGCEAYGVTSGEHIMESARAIVALTGRSMHTTCARAINAALAVGFLPVTLQAALRGRRPDQIAAEMRESRSRIRHLYIR